VKLEEIGSWQAPDGLGYSGMRPVRLKAAGYFLVSMAAIFLVASLVLGTYLWNKSQREQADRQKLESEGARVEATIERLWRSGDKENTPLMSYRFEVDGRVVRGSTPVPRERWRRFRPGDPVAVRYLASNPAINHPADWRMGVTPAFVAFLVPAMFIGFAVLMGVMVSRQSRLLSEGRPAPGIVVKTRKADKQMVVSYEFRLLSGAVRKGHSSANKRSVPAVGSVICVIYDPDNPRRNAVYPFSLVELENVR
jgi:hypothetical protein